MPVWPVKLVKRHIFKDPNKSSVATVVIIISINPVRVYLRNLRSILEIFLVNHVAKMELQVLFLTSFLSLTQAQIYNGCDYSVLYRHPANCHQYLQCSNGYEYIMNCNEDLVFNEKMQYCDWDYNVPECSEGTTTTTSIMTTTKSNCVEVGVKSI